jgi:Family of unknown function (DUF6588)
MMMKRIVILIVLGGIILTCGCGNVFAQQQNDLESNLAAILNNKMGQDYLTAYTQPLVNALGSAMFGGLYQRGYIKQFPHLDLGLTAVYLMVPKEAKSFRFGGEFKPTFFGKGTSASTDTSGIPGSGLTGFYLPQLQLNLGLTSNVEFLLRGAQYHWKEVGDIRLLGAGVKFGLTDVVPKYLLALDFSVQAVYQTMKVENWLNSATFGMNIQASTPVLNKALDIYGGLGYEISALKFDTTRLHNAGSNNIGVISMDGENDWRMCLGLSYTLFILNVHLDYNLGFYNSISGGLMISF